MNITGVTANYVLSIGATRTNLIIDDCLIPQILHVVEDDVTEFLLVNVL